jgi:eukaryotic-like serine/threonine-protein kinase
VSWVKALLYCFTFIAVLVVSSYVAMSVLIREEGTITCPDIVGKELSDARRLAEGKELSVLISRYEKRKDIPYNHVISQRPEPNMPVRKGRILSVVVSEGPVLVNVPLLTNHTLTYAEAALKDRSISMGRVINVPVGTLGTVVAQSPSSGQNIVADGGITIFLGGRPKKFYLMTNVVGRNIADIIDELATKQIKYTITYIERAGRPAGTIVETSIPLRTLFGEDITLEIKVAGG